MKTIACFGSGSGQVGDPIYDAMVKVGRLLAENGCLVVTGGYGGSGMEAPAKGAKEAGGRVLGYILSGKSGNPFLSETIRCRAVDYLIFPREQDETVRLQPQLRPQPEVEYGVRLGNLLLADGFIVAANGGPGTMVELMAVINLSYKLWKGTKRLAILKPRNNQGSGWDTSMLDQLAEWEALPPEARVAILICETPEQAIEWVTT